MGFSVSLVEIIRKFYWLKLSGFVLFKLRSERIERYLSCDGDFTEDIITIADDYFRQNLLFAGLNFFT